MNSIIKVQVFGKKDEVLKGGCGCNNNCNGCGNNKKNFNDCNNCGDKVHSKKFEKTLGDLYKSLENFVDNSDIKDNIKLEFIDLNKINFQEEEYYKIKNIIDKGFNPPITVIDNIIRFYGGISNILIYKDVKELLEL